MKYFIHIFACQNTLKVFSFVDHNGAYLLYSHMLYIFYEFYLEISLLLKKYILLSIF